MRPRGDGDLSRFALMVRETTEAPAFAGAQSFLPAEQSDNFIRRIEIGEYEGHVVERRSVFLV
ncbi:hypothetical protein NJ75_00447 [Novosphingobium subterraneum]|uniref:Uncharacterized protein n=1 Tax=Novosphingobium subterraneum TaxID=48936 RepID=A0A0B8ZR96_9SPHN|nr:hypothetical protein NJ75_00447 [Novosphingobium subterraneum]